MIQLMSIFFALITERLESNTNWGNLVTPLQGRADTVVCRSRKKVLIALKFFQPCRASNRTNGDINIAKIPILKIDNLTYSFTACLLPFTLRSDNIQKKAIMGIKSNPR